MKTFATYTDEALLDLSIQGNHAAFKQIYNRYWKKIFSLAYQKVNDAEVAKEITQEAFIALWNQIGKSSINELPLYLAGIVRFKVYKHWSQIETNLEITSIADTTPTNSNLLEYNLLIEELYKLADQLPPRQKIIFIQHKLLDQPLDIVAQELGISIRTAEDHVTKLMRKIRQFKGLYNFIF